MELIKKSPKLRIRDLLNKINDDNLFLLSSSMSYYSAVSIAPFLLILLSVASFLGREVQAQIVSLSSNISPGVGRLVEIIFNNVNQTINIGSITGMIGVLILFFTSSLVFLQLRFSLDVIYGLHDLKAKRTFLGSLKELIFAMLVVFVAGLFLIISSSLPGLVSYFGKDENILFIGALIINFMIYVSMFWGILFFAPSKRPGKRDVLKMALLASVFFVIGNTLLGVYFRNIARTSIYGAAGSLFVFLIWSYYSSFTMFLSVEILHFRKRMRRK